MSDDVAKWLVGKTIERYEIDPDRTGVTLYTTSGPVTLTVHGD